MGIPLNSFYDLKNETAKSWAFFISAYVWLMATGTVVSPVAYPACSVDMAAS